MYRGVLQTMATSTNLPQKPLLKYAWMCNKCKTWKVPTDPLFECKNCQSNDFSLQLLAIRITPPIIICES